jgi:hypothetical protein
VKGEMKKICDVPASKDKEKEPEKEKEKESK